MIVKKNVLMPITLIALFVFSNNTSASSGNRIIRLAWQPSSEILEYHSCGSADMCWVAKVKNKKTKNQIAMLRCDGEILLSSVGKGREQIVEKNCDKFASSDKFQEIPLMLGKLLNR